MTPITSKKAQDSPRPASIDRSNQLFVEANQLSEAAYALLGSQPFSVQNLREFSELKRRADEKYLEARQEWLKAKDKINRSADMNLIRLRCAANRHRYPVAGNSLRGCELVA